MLGDIASAKFAPAKSHYLLFAHNEEEISNQKRFMIDVAGMQENSIVAATNFSINGLTILEPGIEMSLKAFQATIDEKMSEAGEVLARSIEV